MPWNVGDLVPLKLIVPDGDFATHVTVAYTTPSGTGGAVSPDPTTSDGGVTWTAQQQVTLNGEWTFTWTIVGTGEGVTTYTIWVDSTPPVPWTPSLRDVADYVPTRTIPVDSPVETPLMTFDQSTIPSGEQVYRQIAAATRWVNARILNIPTQYYAAAQDVAALRAAALVELSFPQNDNNVSVTEALMTQANDALKMLIAAIGRVTDDPIDYPVPIGSFPPATTLEDFPYSKTSDWGGQQGRVRIQPSQQITVEGGTFGTEFVFGEDADGGSL